VAAFAVLAQADGLGLELALLAATAAAAGFGPAYLTAGAVCGLGAVAAASMLRR
jgi:hypothetical protein